MTDTIGDLKIDRDGPVLRLVMNRPERRNSLSRAMVDAMHRELSAIGEGDEIRAVVISGEGPVFCSGADIDEFLDAARSGKETEDAERVGAFFAGFGECPAPIIARVSGSAFGGGVGVACAADIVIAAGDAKFALSEARIGLIPAVISPYVVAAIGEREAKARMLLAAPFDAQEALRIGLVHSAVPVDELDTAVEATISNILQGAPGALRAIKQLPRQVRGLDAIAARSLTTRLLAERLAEPETQEGLAAFTEKRRPSWVPE